jgi:hypothetical protein
MTVAVELIGDYTKPGAFGTDGLSLSTVKLVDQADTQRVLIGPQVISWNGRMIQFMLFVRPEAQPGAVALTVTGGVNSAYFNIVDPLDLGVLSGNITIVAGQSRRNTIVVDSLVLSNGTFKFPTTDIDLSEPGNQAYLPTRILSLGPIRLVNAQIDLSGASGSSGSKGGNGGPGGGGGGGGMPANGGDGYTGGGGVGEQSNHNARHGGEGTGSGGAHYYDGGSGLSGVAGGEGCEHGNTLEGNDEGGAGGTGHPFGKSGARGTYKLDSQPGGFGAGSGGGTSTSSGTTNYAGGGAGYATKGAAGEGAGDNGGQITGNEMLVPLAGGSGGASGNVAYGAFGQGGSGGGGGGAIEFASFSTFEFQSGTVSARGGNGSSGAPGLGENGAGGGGGSGGAVVASARDSLTIGSTSSQPSIDVSGGTGGSGYKRGGDGGLGRIRLDGFVSSSTGNPQVSKYFDLARGYAGPAIQAVRITANDFTVIGTAGAFEGPANPVHVYYSFRSNPNAWQTAVVTPAPSTQSHTPLWTAGPFPHPNAVVDSEIYVVALEDNATPLSGTYADRPREAMTHVSGYLAKIRRAPQSILAYDIVDFGLVRVGECKDTFIVVRNTGDADLSVTRETIPDPRFTFLDALPVTVTPSASAQLRVRFCPADTNAANTTNTVVTNATQSPQIVILLGKGKKGILSVPTLLDFGNVKKGACKDTFMFVRNLGNDSLTVTSESVTNPKFSAVAPSLPATIPPHDSAKFTFRYCSIDTGVERSDGTLTSGEDGHFVLSAHTSLAAIVADSAIDLGCVIVGRPVQAKAYIRNRGNAAIHGLTATYVGADGQIIGYPASDLLPLSTDSVTIELTATTAGSYNGAIHFSWAPSAEVEETSVNIIVTAHVSDPAKLVVLHAPRIEFDTIDVGATSSDSCFEFTNYSCEPIDQTEILLQGSSAFRVTSSSMTGQLVDSSRWRACIAFTPTRGGVDSAFVRLRVGSDTTAAMLVRGVGLGPVLPVMLALDTVYGTPGDTVPVQVRLVNDVTNAGITSITFRVFFDPMQLDMKRPRATATGSAFMSDVARSIGDHEVTITRTTPFTSGVIAELPMEILMPTSNTAPVQLSSTASFGSARAALASASPGEVIIAQCDTTERIILTTKKLDVAQNTPNPFNPRTVVRVTLAEAGFVTLRVRNILGEVIDRPFAGTLGAGDHALFIDASAYPTGTYEYSVEWSDDAGQHETHRRWMNVVR